MRRDLFSASHLVLAAVALLVGVGLGRFGPASDLQEAQKALAAAEARECPDRGVAVGRQIARALGGRLPVDNGVAPEPPAAPEPIDPAGLPPSAEPDAIVAGEPTITFDGEDLEGFEDMTPEEQDAALEQVADAVALRRAQARQALLEQVDPSDEQLIEIEDALARMNEDLAVEAGALLDLVRAGQPDRRDGLEFARNTIDVLLEAEDAMLATLTDEQLATTDPDVLNPLSFVDEQLVRSLVEVGR